MLGARATALGVGAVILVAVGPVYADEPDAGACGTAYENAQVQRRAGRLLNARQAAQLCASTCPHAIATDCAQWFSELEKEVPSIVVSASDGVTDLVDFRVLVDGKRIVDRLDGRAFEVDPGPHQLVLERKNTPPRTLNILVREGDRGRLVSVVYARDAETRGRSTTIAGWTFGGIALASFVGFGTLAAISSAQKSELEGCAPRCEPSRVDAMTRNAAFADVALGVGIVATAASVVFFLIPRPTNPTGVSPR